MMVWWGALRAETTMAHRQAAFRLALFVSIMLTIARQLASPYHNTSWSLAAELVHDYQGVLGVLAVLMGAAVAVRERSERVDALLGSMPHDGSSWLAGKFLGGYLPVLGAGLANLLAVALWQGASGISTVHWAAYGQHGLIFLGPTVLFFYSMGFLAGTLLPQTRAAYLASLFIWVMAYPLLDPVWAASQHPLSALGRLLPIGRVTDYAVMVGYTEDWLLILGHRGVYLALSGLFLVLALWWSGGFRRRHLLAAMAFTLLLVISFSSYAGVTLERFGLYQAELATLPAVVRGHQPLPDRDETGRPRLSGGGLRVLSYQLAVELDLEKSQLGVQAQLTCINSGTEALAQLQFTLRDNFSVERITGADDQSLGYRREGNFLRVELPAALATGEKMEITVLYSGMVEHWRGETSRLHLAYALTPQWVYVPALYGWYPVVGQHTLAQAESWEFDGRSHERITDYGAYHAPADFAVQVRGLADLQLAMAASGVEQGEVVAFNAKAAPGVSLLAAPYAKTVAGRITIYHHPDTRPSAERMAYELANLADFYASLLVQDHEYRLTLAQSPLGATAAQVLRPSELVLLNDTVLGNPQRLRLEPDTLITLVEPVWFQHQSELGNAYSYLDFGVMGFLQSLYRAEQEGAAVWEAEWFYRQRIEEQTLEGGGQRLHDVDRGLIIGRHFCYDSNRIWLRLASLSVEHGMEASMRVARALLEVDPWQGLLSHEVDFLVETALNE